MKSIGVNLGHNAHTYAEKTCGEFVTAKHVIEEESYAIALSLQNNKYNLINNNKIYIIIYNIIILL